LKLKSLLYSILQQNTKFSEKEGKEEVKGNG